MAHLLGVIVNRDLHEPQNAVMLITLTVSVVSACLAPFRTSTDRRAAP